MQIDYCRFPSLTVPPLELLPRLVVNGFVIAIISFSINISMASIFAEKHKYRINANQELLAAVSSLILRFRLSLSLYRMYKFLGFSERIWSVLFMSTVRGVVEQKLDPRFSWRQNPTGQYYFLYLSHRSYFVYRAILRTVTTCKLDSSLRTTIGCSHHRCAVRQ